MAPVRSKKIIKIEEHIFVFLKTATGIFEVCPIQGKQCVIGNQGLLFCGCPIYAVNIFLGLELDAHEYFVEDIACL